MSPTQTPASQALDEIGAAPTDDAAMTAKMTGPQSAELSRKANEAAAKISEIDSCVTAILGDTCVAGVTFDAQYQGALTDRIRDMVASCIQSAVPRRGARRRDRRPRDSRANQPDGGEN